MFAKAKKKNEMSIIMLVMILALVVIPLHVKAAVAIDVGASVSLKIEYKHAGKGISGASFDVYKVADVSETVEFTKTEEFASFTGTFEDIDQSGWVKQTKEAVDYVGSHKEIKPFASGKTDKDGLIIFPNAEREMTTGLYLVIGQEYTNEGKTYICDPFFICLPNLEVTDEWNYHVTANPKVTIDTETEVPKDSKLPQTGMLKWPIPVLAGTGLLFFMIGWAKRQKEET